MSTEKHSPGPWHVQDNTEEPGGQLLVDSPYDGAVAICGVADKEPGVARVLHDNARRIVACVNACAGIPTEALEQGVVREALEALARLSFAAGCRESTMGSPCRLIEVKAELADAAKQACSILAKAHAVLAKAGR